jgi:hypothetical protein
MHAFYQRPGCYRGKFGVKKAIKLKNVLMTAPQQPDVRSTLADKTFRNKARTKGRLPHADPLDASKEAPD